MRRFTIAISTVALLTTVVATKATALPITLDFTNIAPAGTFLARASGSSYSPAVTGFSFQVISRGNRPGSNVADRNHNFSPARGLGIEGPLSGNSKTPLEPAGPWNWDTLSVSITQANSQPLDDADLFIMGFDLIMDRAPVGSVGFSTTSLTGAAGIPGSIGFHSYIAEPLVYDPDLLNARVSFDITSHLNEALLDNAQGLSGRQIQFYPRVGDEYGPGFWVASVTLGSKEDILAAQSIALPAEPVSAVPVPAALPLLAAALGGLAAFRRRRG